jgi:hypothetical protein
MMEADRCSECGKILPGNGSVRICPDCSHRHDPNQNASGDVPFETDASDSLRVASIQSFPSRFRVSHGRYAVQRRLLAASIGLHIAGLASLAMGMSVHVLDWPGTNRLYAALATLGLASGPVIIWGALCLMRLQSLWLIRLSCWLAIMPCGIGWIVGLPIGLWTLNLLSRPDVFAAFQYRKAEYDAEQSRILEEADEDLRDS